MHSRKLGEVFYSRGSREEDTRDEPHYWQIFDIARRIAVAEDYLACGGDSALRWRVEPGNKVTTTDWIVPNRLTRKVRVTTLKRHSRGRIL